MRTSKIGFWALTLLLGSTVLFHACKKEETAPPDPNATEYNESNGVVTVIDHGQGTGTMTWTSDKIWLLDHLVFVNESQTLTIEAGTVIKGKSGQETDASALVVARGGKIIAEGTATNPIIFTAEADNLSGNIGNDQRGLWGGVILLGKAQLNSSPGETAIEGIPTTESRGLYGGSDDNDNSGILKYISIRHGGTDIGEGNEINGLTFGAVGSGTTVDYIEVIANKDDGMEFFGGTPRVKHILVAYCADDGLDYDEGFRGSVQFYLVIQDPNAGDRLGEHDGGTDPETGTPYAIPEIYNNTYIGRGADAGKRVITFRDNAGGHYYNSIFANQAKGVDVELLSGPQDSYKQLLDGNLSVENCLFQNVADGTASGIFRISTGEGVSGADSTAAVTLWAGKFDEFSNSVTPGDLVSAANPVPPAGTAQNGVAPTDPWFDNVTYQGAFEPGGSNWAQGWTLLFGSK
ncbi:MAG: hypothetical protein GXO83_11410 [Chlorobi bacterium]|nr:hypothetical protein [Chlorobiota bacterium]